MSELISLLLTLRGLVQSRAALHLEVLALRHQLHVLQRSDVDDAWRFVTRRLGPFDLRREYAAPGGGD